MRIEKALVEIDKLMVQHVEEDPPVQWLMTVPGVGRVTALTYKATKKPIIHIHLIRPRREPWIATILN